MITAIDEKTALVLIDLQKGITGANVVHPVADVLKNAAKLVAAFRKAGQPVVYVNVNPGNAKWTTARKDAPRFSGNMPADWTDIVPEVDPQAGDIFVTKHTWGAFFETPLHNELQKRGVTGIVLGGISTSIGVEGTGRQASELGYNISFAIDVMTDMAASAHEHSVNTIFPRMGEVGTSDEVIAKL